MLLTTSPVIQANASVVSAHLSVIPAIRSALRTDRREGS